MNTITGAGSSPLARGTLLRLGYRGHQRGLIPARAGNTPRRRQPVTRAGAHPRSRGEHPLKVLTRRHVVGSSPLARGTPNAVTVVDEIPGLIPARAGNTPPPRCAPQPARAHPRSRGEHMYWLGVLIVALGSSPLARGTQCVPIENIFFGGLIPARAGNTLLTALRRAAGRAHPRSRGEHVQLNTPPRVVKGSSPLARGTLSDMVRRYMTRGLIPARAGNTFSDP